MSICIVPAEFHEPIIDRFTISEVNSVVNQRQKLEGADFKSSFTLNSISDECCRYRKVGALQLNGFCGPTVDGRNTLHGDTFCNTMPTRMVRYEYS